RKNPVRQPGNQSGERDSPIVVGLRAGPVVVVVDVGDELSIGDHQALFKNTHTLRRGAWCDDDFDYWPERFERFAVRAEKASGRLAARGKLDLDRFPGLFAGDVHGRGQLFFRIEQGDGAALLRVETAYLELAVTEIARETPRHVEFVDV